MNDETMVQSAPWPTALVKLVEGCKYKKGWEFHLYNRNRGQESKGLTLDIIIDCVDTYNPEEETRIRHSFIVPAASYNETSWRRWLFDQILLVERHESAEFFQIDGVRPYAPHHGPGFDPYQIFEHGDIQDARTNYLGEKRDQDAPLPGCA